MDTNNFIAYIAEQMLPLNSEGNINSKLEQIITGFNEIISKNGPSYDKHGFWSSETISAFQQKYLTQLLLTLTTELDGKDIYSKESFKIIKNAMHISEGFNPGPCYAKNCAKVKELAMEYLFDQV